MLCVLRASCVVLRPQVFPDDMYLTAQTLDPNSASFSCFLSACAPAFGRDEGEERMFCI